MGLGRDLGFSHSYADQNRIAGIFKRSQIIIFWWLKQLLYWWQRYNYKAYNAMEVFLLLLVVSRCAETDVLWLDFWGCSSSFNLGILLLLILMPFSA